MARDPQDTASDEHGGDRRILIIKPSSLGDIVHALPVLVALRKAHPSAHIAWLVTTTFAPLLDGHPMLDEVLVFHRTRYGRMWRSPRALVDFWRFIRDLRSRRFDLVVDLQGLARSAFLARVSGAPQRIGFAAARELAPLSYTQRVHCPPDIRHAVDKNLYLVAALNLPVGAPQFPLAIRSEEIEDARALLAGAAGHAVDDFTAVFPGARWETKRWRPDRLAELIDRIHADGLPICVLLGSPDDRDQADRVAAACRTTVVNLVGQTSLRELVALIDLSSRVICHDSGPLHVAAALRKPLVALFGPTDPAATGPYSDVARVVRTPVDCAPCRLRTCDHHSCMEQLDVETVLAQVRALASNGSTVDPAARALP